MPSVPGILTAHSEQLLAVADFLLAHERMSRTQFEACMAGQPIPEEEEGLFQSFLHETAATQPKEPEQPEISEHSEWPEQDAGPEQPGTPE